jgi:hypothetical protein
VENKPKDKRFFSKIVGLLQSARSQVLRTVNRTMVVTYFEIGRLIVEKEQGGQDRANYGKSLLKELSKRLTEEFGRGFSVTNLSQMRQFYLAYSMGRTVSDQFKSENQKHQTLSDKFENSNAQILSAELNLSWSHYLHLMRIDNHDERRFYEIQAVKDPLLTFTNISSTIEYKSSNTLPDISKFVSLIVHF